MADLTPEEIALGLRAVKAGWAWAVGDVVRFKLRLVAGSTSPDVIVDTERATGEVWTAGEDGALYIDQGLMFPDPTARGFVSAALAQVRERTGKVLICRAHMADRWRVEDTRGVPLSDRGDERTEADAVVAALEATR